MIPSLYDASNENKAIWVYLEQQDGVLEHVSLELLCKGRQLADANGWPLTGLLLGSQVSGLAEQAFSYGADNVRLADHPLLKQFAVDAYARTAFQALMQGKPSVFLLGATANGRDLAARLAVRLRTGLNADCTNLYLEPPAGQLISEVSGFGGGVLALISMRHHRPQMATVRPGVFQAEKLRRGQSSEIVYMPVDLSPGMIQTRIIERKISGSADLTLVPVLVAGGRGVGTDFSELEELAETLKGSIGATRPPVDMGIMERERQIGQTGVVCSPKLAICCGISGAFHFIVGIEKSGTVVAVNSDPEAPIFDYADYCIVGDLHKIIPLLTQKLRTALGEAHE